MAGKHGSRLQAWRQEREMTVPISKGKHKAVGTNRKRCENFNLISPLRRCACSRKGAPPTVLQTMASAGRNIFKYLRPWRTFFIQTSASIDFCFALSLFFFLRQAPTRYPRLILNAIILRWCQVLGLQMWTINPLEIFIWMFVFNNWNTITSFSPLCLLLSLQVPFLHLLPWLLLSSW